ncbi:MAG: NUMOD3 domain-containing DNA-binding protein [Halolamina sp.]
MNRRGIETRELVGENHPQHGSERSEETRAKISETLAGREFSEEHRRRLSEGHEGRTLPEKVRQRISESLSDRSLSKTTRRRMSESTSGESNPNWKGGRSPRYGAGWSVSREFVRRRNKQCQSCGHCADEYLLDVHHIIPVRRFRDSDTARLAEAPDPRNLVLLCRRCHPKAEHGRLEFESGTDPPE